MATVDSRHSFRYPVLATSDQREIKQRVVVLRQLIDNCSLVFYSDSRTQKVKHIEANSTVSLCFFDAKEKIQIHVNGKATTVSGKPKDLESHQRRDYNSELPPGTIINAPGDQTYNDDTLYFSEITVKLETIDWLQLKRRDHHRAKFTIHENGEWKGHYVVP